MENQQNQNPLLPALRKAIQLGSQKTGKSTTNWLLALLVVLDRVRGTAKKLDDNALYTYHYSLKDSRGGAIRKLVERYAMPKLKISDEGITIRGAPGLRFFWEIEGVLDWGAIEKRKALCDEAIEEIRKELMAIAGQEPVKLPAIAFNEAGTFVPALLEAVHNRSQGRLEQALVGAKLHLRFPNEEVEMHRGFAGDKQTNRDTDFHVGNLRVSVSVAPKNHHFVDAKQSAEQGNEVILVVSEKAFDSARKRVKQDGAVGRIRVVTVAEYVAGNMAEMSADLRVSSHEMCMRLVSEYNRRIMLENDDSLQVVLPSADE